MASRDPQSDIPHDLGAEEAILGSILKQPSALSRVVSELVPEDFFRQQHRVIYQACVELFTRSVDIDYHTLSAELQRLGTYEQSGGIVKLSEIDLATSTAAHIEHYAKVVRDHGTRRRGISAAQSISDVFYRASDEIEEELRRATAYLHGVTGREATRRLLYPEQWVNFYMDRLEAVDEEGALGISTGWIDVDRITLGLMPGTLVLVAARPGLGKSEFVEQLALNVALSHTAPANTGCHAGRGWSLFVSIEMTEEELVERAASQWSGLSKDRLIRGHMTQPEYARIVQALSEIQGCRLALAIEHGVTTQDIRALALQLQAEKGHLDLIVVDYVQLLKDRQGKDSSRADDIGLAANELKRLAAELQCTVVAPAQLNRGVEDRRPPIPILSDLRDSGQLEQAADVVLVLYRDEIYNPDTEKRGITDVIVRKHRRYGRLAGSAAQLLYSNRFLDLEVFRA